MKKSGGLTRNQLLLVLVGGLLILFLFGLFNRPNDKGVGVGKEFSPSDGPALIASGEKLFEYSENATIYNTIAQNIAFFARNTIAQYFDGSLKDVAFKITSINKEGKKIRLQGDLTDTKEKLSILVDLLNNERVYLQISSSSGASIDTLLPANSKRNQFIGSLPFKNDVFAVSYIKSTDGFMVTLFGADLEKSKIDAKTYLVEQLKNIENEKISTVAVDINGDPKSIVL